MDTHEFIVTNWRNPEALSTLLGTSFVQDGQIQTRSIQFHFGSIPTEQAWVEVTQSKITRITTWSGLNWSARYGYGKPTVDISIAEAKQLSDSTPF